VIAYLPLGFLLAVGLKARLSAGIAVIGATLLCAALSVTMEAVQMFMPSRIASNVDVLTNTLGSLIGALAASLFSPSQRLGAHVARLRNTWVIPGAVGEVGLVVILLWTLTQLHPTAQLFGTGNLRSTLELPVWMFYNPGLFLSVEATVVVFNLLGLGLAVSALSSGRPGRMIAGVVGTGLCLKAFAAVVIAKSAAPLAWLTPGIVLGLLAGAFLLYPLTRLQRRFQFIVAALCVTLAVAAINLAPDNPYQRIPLQMIAGPSHLLSLSDIVRALSELWPFVAVAFLVCAAVAGPGPRPNRL
jgi:hypothetical protein